MLDRFLDGFFEGLTWMFMFLIFALVIAIACAPFTLALMYSNALWLLLYFIVAPVDFGLWNIFF